MVKLEVRQLSGWKDTGHQAWLESYPRTHMVERENNSHCPLTSVFMPRYTHIHTLNKRISKCNTDAIKCVDVKVTGREQAAHHRMEDKVFLLWQEHFQTVPGSKDSYQVCRKSIIHPQTLFIEETVGWESSEADPKGPAGFFVWTIQPSDLCSQPAQFL